MVMLNQPSQLKQRAHERLDLLAGIIGSAMDAIIALDDAQRIVLFNAAAERIFACPANEAIGSSIERFIPQRFRTTHSMHVHRFGESELTNRAMGTLGTLWGLRVTGEEFPIEASISKVESGGKKFFTAVIRDITERQRAEEAVRDNEERLRLAIQAGKMYAYEWDVPNNVLVRSPEYVDVLGPTEPRTVTPIPLEQALGRIHPDDRRHIVKAIAERSPQNPTVNLSYRALVPGKAPVWVRSSGRAFFDGQGRMLRVVGMVADVTDQKLAEEKLREYEKAVEGLEEMIVVVDREYRYLVANRKFLSMRHLTREQVVGRFAHEIVSKDAYEAIVKEKLEECFRGKVVRYEMKYTYPEIGERDLLVSYFPIEGTCGIDRAACIFQDITERKRAEEALSGISRKLIEAQEQERARIARELHDDIGQRLSLIIVNLGILEQKIPIERAIEHAEIHNVVDELDQLVTDVHDISHRLHSSKLEHLGLVAAIKGFCKEFAEKQRVEIDVQTHDLADSISPEISVSLFRVLQEALHNAVKYSGVAHFDVALSQSSGEIQLTVRDRGAGFDLDHAMKGRGLGLASMQERLRLIDGELSIKSQLGSGTTIHASVPIKSGKEVA
ncbi:MAG TPA: PAS domain S-box protein [Terriglobales bacterium]|nr:PAS domain S-box protein [Terriglobales bacterium]